MPATRHRLTFALASALLLAPFVLGCGLAPVPTEPVATALPTTCQYREEGALPDPACTPGALNPAVSQDTIAQTICMPGWTATIRPPVSYTNALKLRQMAAYGVASDSPSNYEEDHYLPLELGGDPRDERNLWPEPGRSPNSKDRVEDHLHADVCAGRISLADAQQQILTDWRALAH